MPKRYSVPADVHYCIDRIVQHYLAEAQSSCEALAKAGHDTSNHIYHDLQSTDHWLKHQTKIN